MCTDLNAAGNSSFTFIFPYKYKIPSQFKESTMNKYVEYLNSEIEREQTDCEEINEAFLKTTSKLLVANKVRTLSGQVKRAKTEAEKLDLIASQNTWLAGLILLKD